MSSNTSVQLTERALKFSSCQLQGDPVSNISSYERQRIFWLIFISEGLAEKNKKNNYGGFERLRKCSGYKNNFKDRDVFRKKPLKETKLVPVSFKLKRLLYPPDVNFKVTRHYRPEARSNVIYSSREQPSVDT